MIKLRKYQSEAVDRVRSSLASGNRAPLLVLPTGGGKTTIFSYVTSSAARKGKCVYLIAHRAELVKQISMTLARFGTPHQIIAPQSIVRQSQIEQFKAYGKSLVDPSSSVFVASVQTLVKRIGTYKSPDLIVIDESHHLTTDSSWGRVVDAYPNAKLLPVTATPCRLDGKGLGVGVGGFADDMVMGPTMRELIDGGFLSPYRIFAPPNALDLTGVRTRMGDYAKDQLADAVDKPSITGNSVEHYLRLARGKRAVAFCVSVAHAQHVAHEFNSSGVKAEFLDGTIDSLERDRIIKRFESGETLILSSCDIVSEGFDLPSIEVAILLRPTQSLSLHIQQVGRALRTSPGKSEALIFDHVGAVMRHGLPDEDRSWTLEGVKKKKRKTEDDDEEDIKVKCCPDCFSIHEPQPVCPNCGHVYEIKARKIEHIEGELKEIEQAQIEKMRRDRMLQQGKAQTVDELVQQGMSKGRAEKIIEARLAKQALQEEIFNKLSEIQVKTGFGPYQTCGLTRADILRLKPKQLKELNATITTVNN